MDNIGAEQEIKRIERELDAKNPPPGKPPTRQVNSGGGGGSRGKRDPKKIGQQTQSWLELFYFWGLAQCSRLEKS